MILIMGGNSGLGRKIISGFKKDQIIISVKTLSKVDESISAYPIRFADFDDKKSLEMAFSGIKTLFFISGNSSSEKRIQQHKNVIEIAKEKGVEHVFYTSFIDVEPASPFLFSRSHEKTELFIQESGLEYTILRNNLYSDFIRRSTQDAMDCIRLPAGHGKIAFISREDIAAFAVRVLMEAGAHKNKVYKLTGSEAYSWFDIAKMLSEKYQKTISYKPLSPEHHTQKLIDSGMPEWISESITSMYVAVSNPSFGYGEISTDFEDIVGRPAQDISKFL